VLVQQIGYLLHWRVVSKQPISNTNVLDTLDLALYGRSRLQPIVSLTISRSYLSVKPVTSPNLNDMCLDSLNNELKDRFRRSILI
jgi:hypothetical protein